MKNSSSLKNAKSPTTVGRGKAVVVEQLPEIKHWSDEWVSLHYGDSLTLYEKWQRPTVIVSDGAYGVLGFEGDTVDHHHLSDWYESHIQMWSRFALPCTTLWFWNSEIGWASVHPILEKFGWRYISANIWDKGKGHIAGNVNTARIRQFPIVTEMCVQYVFEPRINGLLLKEWLLAEWKRTGLPTREANIACGVKDAAVRKYFDQGHLWYFPPPEKFELLVNYANQHGQPTEKPYFSGADNKPITALEWSSMRSKFYCPHGVTNVWQRNPLRNGERIKAKNTSRAIHLNQKPLDLMERIILASSDIGDVIWEPFGGLFSASLATRHLKRLAFAAEIDNTYFYYGVKQFTSPNYPRPSPLWTDID
jgi:site-specific DNA-methyltransferase (adenine-specific)